MKLIVFILASSLVAILLAGCGPWGPWPGGRLYGEVVVEPVEDWSFSDEFPLVAVETRPTFPHSVTTIAFTHEGALYVPALSPRGKRWPYFVLDDPRVRIRIGDKVYPGRAVRLTDETDREALVASAQKKYPQLADRDPEELGEVWLFRIDPRG